MKTGFFLTARLGSTRLARKHLLQAAGRPLISVLASKILSCVYGSGFNNNCKCGNCISVIRIL